MVAPVASPQPGPVPRDYAPSAVPHDRLAGVLAGHARLAALVAAVDDEVVRRPSSLPGWSVGHLLTHLARNADSHTGMITVAGSGRAEFQYPGGPAQREGDIAAGAGRPAVELAADLVAGQRRLEAAWDGLHVATWRTGYGLTASLGPTSLADLVMLRWREVEVHAVDLGLAEAGGPSWDGLPPAYLDVEWQWCVARLARRLPPGSSVVLAPGDRPSVAVRSDVLPAELPVADSGPSDPVVVDAPTVAIFRWLAGRGGDPAWPTLADWT